MQDVGYSAKLSAQWKKLIFVNEVSLTVLNTISVHRIPSGTGLIITLNLNFFQLPN